MAARIRSKNSEKRTRRPRANRLPDDVRPEMIELAFDLDPKSKTFRGRAAYDLTLARRKRSLVLHAAGLRVTRVRATWEAAAHPAAVDASAGGSTRGLQGRVEEDRASESIVIRFESLLPKGKIRLELSFAGRVRNDLRGLYRGGSVEDGDAWLASQLCPTDARRLFPCFDEPGIKARYRIAITAPDDQRVLSNAPVQSAARAEARSSATSDDVGRTTTQFETTPPLSSYLIAVAVGPFETSEVAQCGTTEIRVWTLPGKQPLAKFALEAAVASLERLERWFGMRHPYPKLDLVALPAFAFGAMENAGAVFFRDSILLLDPKDANAEDRKRTAEVIAHELSHMWFGNLVTMAWWNDLWLNEAFATWMAYEIVDEWRPDWHLWHDFAHRREHALEMDALSTSHPIAPPIRSADEAQENFDAITYTKGACVLRMLERYLGASVFQAGIRRYIEQHQEGNATAADLWHALAEVSGESVEKIVAPWTLETGYPLVSVEREERAGKHRLRLEQERFLSLPRRSKKPDATRWTIPWIGRVGLSQAEDSPEIRALISKPRHRFEASELAIDGGRDLDAAQDGRALEWIYGNASESGFFRVLHGASERRDLLRHRSSLSPIERIGLIGHHWALARSGHLGIDETLALIAALGDEEDPDVLAAVESVLARMGQRLLPLVDPAGVAGFRDWLRQAYEASLDRIGFLPSTDEDPRVQSRRARLFRIVGAIGRAPRLVEECERRCAEHVAEGRPLPPELASAILGIAAKRGQPFLHSALCAATRSAATPQARRRSLFALGEFDDLALVRTSLDAALDPDLAPAPDRAELLASMLRRADTAPETWATLRRHWRRLEKEMPPILLARLVGVTAEALPPSEGGAIRRFFETHPLGAGERVLGQVAEELAIARRFERTALPPFERFFGASGGV